MNRHGEGLRLMWVLPAFDCFDDDDVTEEESLVEELAAVDFWPRVFLPFLVPLLARFAAWRCLRRSCLLARNRRRFVSDSFRNTEINANNVCIVKNEFE